MSRDDIRRANTLAYFAWCSTDSDRANRFTRLLLLLHYGQNFSTKDTPVYAVGRGTWEHTIELNDADEIVTPWGYGGKYQKILVSIKEWQFQRSDLLISMRAAFVPEIGEHGIALLDSGCPTIQFTSKKTNWRELCQTQG